MLHECPTSKLQRGAVLLTMLFGVLSIFAGGRVLAGIATKSHPVLMPLVAFNVAMGVLYIAAAVTIRKSAVRGRAFAGFLVLINLIALGAIVAYRSVGGMVAGESVIAMLVRVALFAMIYLALGRVVRPASVIP